MMPSGPNPFSLRVRFRHTAIGLGVVLAVLVATAGCAGRGSRSAASGAEPLTVPGSPEWLAMNTPVVREYLSTLPDEAIGSVLRGIKLSDGSRWLEKQTYLGRAVQLPEGAHARFFERAGQSRAYLWLDEGAPPLPLQACESGVRARDLAGRVHAWKQLRWQHGVVYTECPPEQWRSGAEDPGGDSETREGS